jgi:ribonuclease T1
VFWTGLVPSGSKLRRALRKWGLAVVVASGLASRCGVHGPARPRPPAGDATVSLAFATGSSATHRLILNGGTVSVPEGRHRVRQPRTFAAPQARGYYREYTVKTPGARDRGARRIVCGGKPPTASEACFYTDDHYASFRRIEQ